MPATKSLRSGTCASTLLPMMRSARLPSATSRSARLVPKNSTRVGTFALARGLGHVGGRLDAEHRHAQRQEVLQQIAVVAGKLDDEAVRPEPQPILDHVAVGARVLDPARRVGREVGVLREDVVGASRTPCSCTRKHYSQTSACSG